jgi:hypothetical protein
MAMTLAQAHAYLEAAIRIERRRALGLAHALLGGVAEGPADG